MKVLACLGREKCPTILHMYHGLEDGLFPSFRFDLARVFGVKVLSIGKGENPSQRRVSVDWGIRNVRCLYRGQSVYW